MNPWKRDRSPAFAYLLVAAALTASACGRESGPVEQAQVPAEQPAVEVPTAPAGPVVVEELPPGTAGEAAGDRYNELSPPPPQQAEVDPGSLERERRLADREREIAERERRLAELAELERARRDAERRVEQGLREQEEHLRQEQEESAAPAPLPDEPEAEAEAAPESAPEPEPAPEPERVSVRLPAGTAFDVEFATGVSSRTSQVGDTFRARLTGDLSEDGVLAIPSGSEVVGEVTEVQATRRVGGRAVLGLRFTDLVLPSGETVPLDASFVQQGRSETGRDAATIGGGAAAGAVLGRILNKGDKGKGSILGAILGAAVGTAIASRTPGEEIDIPQGAVVGLRLDRDLVIRAVRDRR